MSFMSSIKPSSMPPFSFSCASALQQSTAMSPTSHNQFHRVTTSILRCSQLFGAAPFPFPLRTHSRWHRPAQRKKTIDTVLRTAQLVWKVCLAAVYCWCLLLWKSLPLPPTATVFSNILENLNHVLRAMILVAILGLGRYLNGKFAGVLMQLGTIGHLLEQHGFRMDFRRLGREHKLILVTMLVLNAVEVSFYYAADDGWTVLSVLGAFYLPYWITLLRITQYWHTAGMIQQILQRINRMIKSANESENKELLQVAHCLISQIFNLINQTVDSFGFELLTMTLSGILSISLAFYDAHFLYFLEVFGQRDYCLVVGYITWSTIHFYLLGLTLAPQSRVKAQVVSDCFNVSVCFTIISYFLSAKKDCSERG